ncbi:hypothetical protein [Hahella ganghwensis]|uniref:hypothetical protein n=1 Tax=Hahella ganghwensis TaxID=286420 RepID=UPI000376BBE4|nr:hypothetical protein [Hahella ganghwensis]
MRIAFDLDDTLIPTTRAFSVGSKKARFPFSLIFTEPLRNGAPALIKSLAAEHEIWIYTTSLRKPWHIKAWLRLWGIDVASIINQDAHHQAVSGNAAYARFSKSPAAFGIDLMIDDLPGVEIECRQQGCQSLIIHVDDDHWAERVMMEVERLSSG